MQTNQITMIEFLEQLSGELTIPPVKQIEDIRSDKQKGNSISYDVGEKIGGAAKDISAYRVNFLSKPSLALLKEIENMDVRVAAEVLKRETFFSWFSLEYCRERGVLPGVAKAMQLFIRRIPKESSDSAEARERYTRTLLILSKGLEGVHTVEDFLSFYRYISALLSADYFVRRARSHEKFKSQEKGYLMLKDLADDLALKDFEGPFKNYFYKTSSQDSIFKYINEENWDAVLPTPKANKETSNKPQGHSWKRDIPSSPMRNAGSSFYISTPEEFVHAYGFRACEFGNWVEDDKAAFHLTKASEAYIDLAEILTIPKKAVSLNGLLAMAFGARGSGRALGHYEASKNVINLTKHNGSLGILAHEWFHALDSYLYNASHSFENGKMGFLSKTTEGTAIFEVQDQMNNLLKAIKEGTSIAHIDVRNVKNTYNVYEPFEALYQAVKGNLQSFMDIEIRDFDGKVQRQLDGYVPTTYREKEIKKYTTKRKRFIREKAEALAQYHFKKTGEQVLRVPYTVNHSALLQSSIEMDKGILGKYWSSNVELVARAFESYVIKELKQLRWTSDYLVCGIGGNIYPGGEEKDRIHAAMSEFINLVRPILIKGCGYDE
ncbi:LPD1 domain-containing protein [Psychrobacillus sp. MER TA 171]|uniref:LPD1 domain-containing protein n=1 Tax=Psychrobacillus sp. MER TA 171 TaxID=2939577 RepID=UPI00203B3558|nr:LPD1 domain-containing protein [Psychrobacillus sp. MER TA 171]MCM3358113.1 hypothetical protein [Psychrobacillus sp. MER TA 171]